MIIYQIIDSKTGKQVGKDYTNRNRARSRVDKLDNAYGGYRYFIQLIKIEG